MRLRYRLLLAVLLIGSLATTGSFAQEPAAEATETDEGFFFESVEVNVVNVDVFVTDKKGNPINGLTKDDFSLFEDGLEITGSSGARSSSVGSGAATSATSTCGSPPATA